MPSPVLEPRPGVRTEDDRADVWPWNACLWRTTTGSCVATSSAISQIWRTCISWWRVCQSVGLVCSRWRPEVMHRCSSLLLSDESHAGSVVWYQPLLFFFILFHFNFTHGHCAWRTVAPPIVVVYIWTSYTNPLNVSQWSCFGHKMSRHFHFQWHPMQLFLKTDCWYGISIGKCNV